MRPMRIQPDRQCFRQMSRVRLETDAQDENASQIENEGYEKPAIVEPVGFAVRTIQLVPQRSGRKAGMSDIAKPNALPCQVSRRVSSLRMSASTPFLSRHH